MARELPLIIRRWEIPVVVVLFMAVVTIVFFFLYIAADKQVQRDAHFFPFSEDIGDYPISGDDGLSLESVLKNASMQDKTVILTTVYKPWAAPNSVLDLFLESFRTGEQTLPLLNHLVIVCLDRTTFSHCKDAHPHCFAHISDDFLFSHDGSAMTENKNLKMMWSTRIDFLRSVLEMGYNFLYTDADIMWFRDPFPHFYPDKDFQTACDYFYGEPDDDILNQPNGAFNFVKSNNRSIEFYKFWYSSRELYPGLHDQDVLKRAIISNSSLFKKIGLKMRFLDTAYFGGFCEPSQDLNLVCTMHANCCFGLDNKLKNLRNLLQDWKKFLSLPPGSKLLTWSVNPESCDDDSFNSRVQQPNYTGRSLF